MSFETRFQDLTSLEMELKVFSTPFSVSPDDLSPSLQLEIIDLQNSTLLKERYYNTLDLSRCKERLFLQDATMKAILRINSANTLTPDISDLVMKRKCQATETQ
ncbi:uncharacterized protein LOC124804989 [Schistocerca piceifrons]|uniref:uncharacterized protein LOC124804989 n=1 Tax=Schistocerca piceifrons TaxID=274613 RepID=UPI001F5EFAB8|nr:uncharacterized protein LOC124804989 [Schistocerca piceifrons]